MIHIKNVLERATPLGAAATLLLAAAIPAVSLARIASAAALTERSLMVSSTVASDDLERPDGGTYSNLDAGDPRNGKKVTHEYNFKAGTTGNIEGFTIEYCEKAFDFVGEGECGAPALLAGGANNSFSASAWGAKTIEIEGSVFDITANAANYLTLTLADDEDPVAVTAGDSVTMTFTATTNDFFVNPNSTYKGTSNGTYFAHIQTFADGDLAELAHEDEDDEPAGVVDDGTVTNNITTAIGIYTRVQETLNFSVEGDPDTQHNGAVDDGPTPAGSTCAPLTQSGLLHMGDTNSALEPGIANKVSSYFRLSTNAVYGTDVHYSGDTLKSSNHDFTTSAPTGTAFLAGTERFGIGINVAGSPNLIDLTAETGYDAAGSDTFAYDVGSVAEPKVIASVEDATVNCDTARVDYMASIAPETPAGIYQTKINYIASPRY